MNDDVMLDAVRTLRALVLAGEHYRQVVADSVGLGLSESQAVSFLAIHEQCGPSELALGLGLTTSATTALLDRLERQGVAERTRHPRDRRRMILRLTDRGRELAVKSQVWLQESLCTVDPTDLATAVTAMNSIAGHLSAIARRVETDSVRARSDGLRG